MHQHRSLRFRTTAGRAILVFVAIFTAVSPFVYDWNETHLFNPTWPRHAHFHDAQTMFMGLLTGLFALTGAFSNDRGVFDRLALVGRFYWIAFFCATLAPGVSLDDPGYRIPSLLGVKANELAAGLTLVLSLIGWLSARPATYSPKTPVTDATNPAERLNYDPRVHQSS